MSKCTFLGNNTAVNGPGSPVVCVGKLLDGPRANAKATGCTGLAVPSKKPYPTAGDSDVAALQQSPY